MCSMKVCTSRTDVPKLGEKPRSPGERPPSERPPSERTVHVEVTRVNGDAALTVSDRGVGIDPRTARHLFAPFERG